MSGVSTRVVSKVKNIQMSYLLVNLNNKNSIRKNNKILHIHVCFFYTIIFILRKIYDNYDDGYSYCYDNYFCIMWFRKHSKKFFIYFCHYIF